RAAGPGLALPHQHDQRMPGRSLCRPFVGFTGKRHARAVRALPVALEPVAIVALPRVIEQTNVAGASAPTAPLDVVEPLVSLGDGVLVSRNRVGDLLVGQLDVGLSAAR